MKRIAVFAALAAAIMALPAGSSAATDCSTFDGGAVGPIQTERGGTGVTGTPGTTAYGVCVDDVAPAQGFHGGYVEAGVGEDPATGANDPDGTDFYVIVDGDDENTLVSAQGGGYAGLSNYETGTKDNTCDQNDNGSGTNSGDCLHIRNTPVQQRVPLLVCGNTTGKSYTASGRDGCTIP